MKEENYAFCNVYDTEFMKNCLVEILEYTHHKSAVPRAKVLYSSKELSKEFYIPRSKLIKPIVLKSHVLHHLDGYNIKVIAYFYKHPDQEFCDNTTHYKIQTINISGFAFDTLKHLSEFINKPVSLVKAEIEKQLLYYVDELPF